MKNEKQYVAFFDLDKTIISINSGYILVKLAYEKGFIGKRDVSKAIFQSFLYKFSLKSTESIIDSMGQWLKGIKEEAISALADEGVKGYLLNSVYPEVFDEIAFHKNKNAETVILSSAIGQICRPIASLLGIDSVVCTEMESVDGILSGDPVLNYCFGDEKRIRLSSFCREHNFDTASAFYYADSIADLSALASVGNPVCVNPDKKLKKEAIDRDWRICNWEKKQE
jgi:HAD superfamily hydrolase (TIGR01490 family)